MGEKAMKKVARLFLGCMAAAVAGLAAGCDSEASTSGSGGGTTSSNEGGGGTTTTAAGGTGTGGTGGAVSTGGMSTGGMSTGGGGAAPQNKGCVDACNTPADCANPAALPVTDADNFTCEGGACVYKGCNSTQECKDSYPSLDLVCSTVNGYPLKSCLAKCDTPVDCVSPGSTPITDANNYACESGVCQYKGCNSTQECKDAYPSLDLVCANVNGHPLKGCLGKCSTPADCVGPSSTPITDANNYACESGVCQYKGCNSTQECEDTYPNLSFVCH